MAVKKKAIDTWKTKLWYSLIAPKLFNEAEIAQIPAQDPQHLLNRIIDMPLKEITHELSHMYINVKLRVEDIRGKNAYSKFIGHTLAREHLQALGRRNRSMLYLTIPTKSKEGIEFTIKVLIVSNGRASVEQKKSLRAAAKQLLHDKVQNNDFGKFIQDVIYGKASSELNSALKKIFPTKRVEIYKTELKEVFDVENVEESEQNTNTTQTEATQGNEAETEESELPVESPA